MIDIKGGCLFIFDSCATFWVNDGCLNTTYTLISAFYNHLNVTKFMSQGSLTHQNPEKNPLNGGHILVLDFAVHI